MFYYKATEESKKDIFDRAYKTGRVILQKFPVLKKTEKFVWISVDGIEKPKRVHLDGKTSFAFPTPEKAYRNLWIKKKYRIEFLNAEIRHNELIAQNCCIKSGVQFHEEIKPKDDLPY